MQEFSYKNQFGSINISFDNDIMTTKFKGAVSISLVEYLIKIGKQLIQNRPPQPWGYISSSVEAQAATPDAYQALIEAGKLFQKHGCVKSSYVLNTPISIAQMKQLLSALGVDTPLEEILFDDLEQAREFMNDFLETYK